MTWNSSRKTWWLGLLVLCGTTTLVSAQGVPLPPILETPPTSRLPLREVPSPVPSLPLPATIVPVAAPPVRQEEKIPAPKEAEDDAKRRSGKLEPPKLGGAPTPGSAIGKGGIAPVFLADVLVSVDRHFPAIRAAEQDRVIANGKQISARGAFDTRLTSEEAFQDGTYDSQRYGVGVAQPIPQLGGAVFARYRLGSGDYPVYSGDRKTAEGGEFSGGIALPLLRGREIDTARANVARSDLDRALVEPNVHLTRLEVARAATRTYWGWVAAGQRLFIAREILRLAEVRDEQLGKRVKAGTLPRIEQEDNRRAIVERQARVVQAERFFQSASISLSLYLRDEAGCPVLPMPSQLLALSEPAAPPSPPQRQKELEEAFGRRPELVRLALQREKTLVDLKLAQNQTLPGLNLGVVGKQDVGFGKRSPSSTSRLDRSSVEVGLSFDLPVQRRDALGKVLSAQGELARLSAQEQFARDRVQLEVQDSANALDRAYELLQRGKDNRLQASYIAEAEQRLFDVGKSDLFRVNLRELTAAEARFLEVDAASEFYRALADYQAALGLDTSKPK